MSKQIRCYVRDPGKEWRMELVEDRLEEWQQIVGGYIEAITLRDDLVMIVNEEGVLKQMEPNCYIGGHWLRGTVIAVGVDGEEFADCPCETVGQLRRLIARINWG